MRLIEVFMCFFEPLTRKYSHSKFGATGHGMVPKQIEVETRLNKYKTIPSHRSWLNNFHARLKIFSLGKSELIEFATLSPQNSYRLPAEFTEKFVPISSL